LDAVDPTIKILAGQGFFAIVLYFIVRGTLRLPRELVGLEDAHKREVAQKEEELKNMSEAHQRELAQRDEEIQRIQQQLERVEARSQRYEDLLWKSVTAGTKLADAVEKKI
jgi:cell shape-determining protein MreC